LDGSLREVSPIIRTTRCSQGSFPSLSWGLDTVNGRIPAPPGIYIKDPVNNGINYQPQLVVRISSINSIDALDMK